MYFFWEINSKKSKFSLSTSGAESVSFVIVFSKEKIWLRQTNWKIVQLQQSGVAVFCSLFHWFSKGKRCIGKQTKTWPSIKSMMIFFGRGNVGFLEINKTFVTFLQVVQILCDIVNCEIRRRPKRDLKNSRECIVVVQIFDDV